MKSKNKISEGNILICEFMGRKFQATKRNNSYTKKFKTYADCKRFIVKNRLIGYAPQLPHCKGLGEFDKSWNWLMPVVAKIYTLGYHTEITATCCEIKKVWGSRSLPYSNGEVGNGYYLPEATWKAVVKFIKWYNLNKINEQLN
jgi:hypothetical protein